MFVKSYWFLSFVKKINKNLGSKYSQKLRDDAKKAAADAFKAASKRLIKKIQQK